MGTGKLGLKIMAREGYGVPLMASTRKISSSNVLKCLFLDPEARKITVKGIVLNLSIRGQDIFSKGNHKTWGRISESVE